MIAIIDYGAGNVRSVANALSTLGVAYKVTDEAELLGRADRIILPGVGSFGYMMGQLREKMLEQPIKKAIADGKPFLGICLGLQALFDVSEESPGIKGLGICKGKVVRLKKGKIPMIGWNLIKPRTKGVINEGYAYFVNSYVVVPKDKTIIAATSYYQNTLVSAVVFDNVLATQFHPEKSGEYGIELLKRWLKC